MFDAKTLNDLIAKTKPDRLTRNFGIPRDELLRRAVYDVAMAARWRVRVSSVLSNHIDDLLSVGMEAAAEAIDQLLAKDDPGSNPLAYMRQRIKWAVKGISGNELIQVNGDTIQRAAKKGRLDLPVVCTGWRLEPRCVPNDALRQLEFMEWILVKCCDTDEQRQMVRLKHEGFTASQIGTQLKLNAYLVGVALRKIEKRAVRAYQKNFT